MDRLIPHLIPPCRSTLGHAGPLTKKFTNICFFPRYQMDRLIPHLIAPCRLIHIVLLCSWLWGYQMDRLIPHLIAPCRSILIVLLSSWLLRYQMDRLIIGPGGARPPGFGRIYRSKPGQQVLGTAKAVSVSHRYRYRYRHLIGMRTACES